MFRGLIYILIFVIGFVAGGSLTGFSLLQKLWPRHNVPSILQKLNTGGRLPR